MNPKLQQEIDNILNKMAPPKDAIGLLTADDVRSIIRQAATQGVMAGWVAGERTARTHWNREIDELKSRIRELEMDKIAAAK
jgi:hypothetical protein